MEEAYVEAMLISDVMTELLKKGYFIKTLYTKNDTYIVIVERGENLWQVARTESVFLGSAMQEAYNEVKKVEEI